jgi:hypothetical protein
MILCIEIIQNIKNEKLSFEKTIDISLHSPKPIFSVEAAESKRRLVFIPVVKGPRNCQIIIRNEPNDVLFIFFALKVNKEQTRFFGQDMQTKRSLNHWKVSVTMLSN